MIFRKNESRWVRWRICLILTFVVTNLSLYGFNNKYDADLISDSLKVNADAVIREYSTVLEIESVRYAKRKVHFVVTIFNKSGGHFGIFNETYHKFLKIENFSGNVYDDAGNLVKELKKNDFNDLSAISGFTLFDDTRIKYLSPITNFYPYTIEYNFEVAYDGLFYYPTWYPIKSYNIACENSNIDVILPKNTGLRYKAINVKEGEINSTDDGRMIYFWEKNNIKAFVEENLSPDLSEIVPKVRLAPIVFEIDGYYGNQQTWQNFGLWVESLNKGRGYLDDETISEIKAEVGDADDTLTIIKEVYKYVQSRTRYVNLKLGIGGYQPIDAQTVHKVGYGDCKALTNYTKSILNIYGIDSYYTLVLAGEEAPPIEVDFPTAQFNHAILSVPFKKDTIWLECTSQTNPFGYIGNFTDDREVLLISDNGGKLVKTPSYKNTNMLKRNASIKVDKNGNALANFKYTYQGAEFSYISNLIELSDSEQKKWIYNNLPFSSFKVNDFALHRNTEDTIRASIYFDVALEKYASISNKRIFIPLSKFKNDYLPLLIPSTNRQNDIYISHERNIIDSLYFTYPSGYDFEYMPTDTSRKFPFGEISITIDKTTDMNQLLVVSSIKMHKGLYDKEYYEQLVDFSLMVNKNNNLKAVLVKKEKPE